MRSILATLVAVLLLPSLAAAQEAARVSSTDARICSASGGAAPALPAGPVGVAGFHEADLAQARRACPRTEVGLGMRAAAVIDTAAFYGSLDAQGVLFGSARLTPALE